MACVAAVDDNVGQVMDAQIKQLKDNTVVDGLDPQLSYGRKGLLIQKFFVGKKHPYSPDHQGPGMTKANTSINKAVSLIDVYPTLVDLCGLSWEPKNEKGHPLDGYSMKELLENPTAKTWKGDRPALTVVYAGNDYQAKPHMQHYAIKTDRYRYILYNNGKEELYDHQNDPNEWNNLVFSENELMNC